MKTVTRVALTLCLVTASLVASATEYQFSHLFSGMIVAAEVAEPNDENQDEFACNIYHSGRLSEYGMCSYSVWSGTVSDRPATGTCDHDIATVNAGGRIESGQCVELQ